MAFCFFTPILLSIYVITVSCDWNQIGSINFGKNVAINEAGDVIAAYEYNIVKVYELMGGDWSQRGTDITTIIFPDGPGLGALDLNALGDIIVIGAPHWRGGVVRAYKFTAGGDWSQR
eukprot:175485_1